ncbi:MAG: ABC transporter permease [Proteobacteria bacterium]|nr:ABC transporter permease [Pseudomonadota bacterium]
MTAGQLSLDRPQAGSLQLRLAGSWRLRDPLPSAAEVEQAFASAGLRQISFDTSQVTDWDSGLLLFLRRVLRASAALHLEADRSGLPEGVRRLLDLAEAVPERQTGAEASAEPLLAWLGRQALDAWERTRDFLAFLGGATVALGQLVRGRARFPTAEFFLVVQECGPRAFGIVSMVSLLVGLILAFMGAIQLRSFGAEIYVADLVAIGMTRDMGPIMVGIIMAGRTGAAFAAQLGTMTVNEEIDALETMGIKPLEYLVLPRMLALMAMMPLLTIYGDALGILGGGLVAITSLDVSFAQYATRTWEALELRHVFTGLLKGSTYGVIVALAGCLMGMKCGRSAEAVGQATTSAVVMSIVFIVVACGLLTVVYDVLGV